MADARADHADNGAAGEALRVAYGFLGRWRDGFTRSARDELAHQAALVALARRDMLRDERKFPAFVRTIARRLRSQAARETLERGGLSLDWSDTVCEGIPEPEPECILLRVRNALVEQKVLLAELDEMLARLTGLNRQLLLSYYEGFSCAELAVRFGIREECIKVRIHRARGKLRQFFEKRVCSQTGEFLTGKWDALSSGDPV